MEAAASEEVKLGGRLMLGRADLEKKRGEVRGVSAEPKPLEVRDTNGRLIRPGGARRAFFQDGGVSPSSADRFPGGVARIGGVESAEELVVPSEMDAGDGGGMCVKEERSFGVVAEVRP